MREPVLMVGGDWADCIPFSSLWFVLRLHVGLPVPFRPSCGSFSYNLRAHDLSIAKIAYHRAISVTAGVVWAAIVSRFWWPAEARRELSKALGELMLDLMSRYGECY